MPYLEVDYSGVELRLMAQLLLAPPRPRLPAQSLTGRARPAKPVLQWYPPRRKRVVATLP
jgi:hypothetical protein